MTTQGYTNAPRLTSPLICRVGFWRTHKAERASALWCVSCGALGHEISKAAGIYTMCCDQSPGSATGGLAAGMLPRSMTLAA
ncbi:MAG: hypothetical protein PVSMB4_01550 [Ktedonobacterales bacterium]